MENAFAYHSVEVLFTMRSFLCTLIFADSLVKLHYA